MDKKSEDGNGPRGELRIWALGHSNRPFGDFLAMLKENGVRRLVDIRTVPKSRAVPWADGARLKSALARAKIGYLHLKELGGLRKPRPDSPNGAWRNASFRGYADYMRTPEFEAALEHLIDLARSRRTAIMCAEAVPWRCHRSLVADALLARGVPVTQVYGPGQARPHKITPFARIDGRRVTYPEPEDPQLELPKP